VERVVGVVVEELVRMEIPLREEMVDREYLLLLLGRASLTQEAVVALTIQTLLLVQGV
jgi:hypothetical protein